MLKRYGRAIRVTPTGNVSSRSRTYRMVLKDPTYKDCDFWMALAGTDVKTLAPFLQKIDEAIPDRAGICRFESWSPRTPAERHALEGYEDAEPEEWANIVKNWGDPSAPLTTWGAAMS